MSEVTNTESEQEAVSLSIQDLVSIKNIIDLSAQRGAFKAQEMASVGQVYNKLASFLESVAKSQQPASTVE
jgi:hypothetical protein